MLVAVASWKLSPYWRAVPRSEVQAFFDDWPVVDVSSFGWLVLKITEPAAVVAVAIVFSPILTSCIFQPLALFSAVLAAAWASAWVCPAPTVQLLSCRQLLVTSKRSVLELVSVITAGGELGEVMSATASEPTLRSLNM